MNDNSPPLEVKVWGPMACWTRPENKVERVSYPVPTPSAARGVLEAIFWKPEIRWRVREIVVLKPIKYVSLLRNEVSAVAGAGSDGISITDARQQRHTLALYDVAYLLRADVVPRAGLSDDPAKWRDQFRRRVERGQCFHRPALGCREFAADFAPPDGSERPIGDTRDLGLMLFDIGFGKTANTPLFFPASLENGRLSVPDAMYDALGGLTL